MSLLIYYICSDMCALQNWEFAQYRHIFFTSFDPAIDTSHTESPDAFLDYLVERDEDTTWTRSLLLTLAILGLARRSRSTGRWAAIPASSLAVYIERARYDSSNVEITLYPF